ncbi:MAG: hypothetical protein DA328_07600 [Nitrososphaeraceae archaeon]|nr:hypothetical protein [Nitrososphaeraceae archaeon]
MSFKLSTIVGKIDTIPNDKNRKAEEFLQYTKINGSSENHHINNLKCIIFYTKYIGKDVDFFDIKKKDSNHDTVKPSKLQGIN